MSDVRAVLIDIIQLLKSSRRSLDEAIDELIDSVLDVDERMRDVYIKYAIKLIEAAFTELYEAHKLLIQLTVSQQVK